MSINVRFATRADIPQLAAFNQAMALETEEKVLPTDIITRGITRFLDNPDYGFYLVAERDGINEGCLAITYEWSDWRDGRFWWIQSVYVVKEARRTGVFNRLYQHVSEMARTDTDVCGLRLYVERENVRAQTTYSALGMEETAYRLYETLFDR